MRKHSSGIAAALPPVMLAVLVVFGLTFGGCKYNYKNYDRTIEELFNKVKFNSRGVLRATTAADEEYDYCFTHKQWEMSDDGHIQAADFNLADAELLRGYYWPSTLTAAYIPSIPSMVSILDSFYDSKYKTNQAPFNAIDAPRGSTRYGWYHFRLWRDGDGSYGGSTQTVQTPLMADYYYFP